MGLGEVPGLWLQHSRLRQEQQEFKASLGYIHIVRPAISPPTPASKVVSSDFVMETVPVSLTPTPALSVMGHRESGESLLWLCDG